MLAGEGVDLAAVGGRRVAAQAGRTVEIVKAFGGGVARRWRREKRERALRGRWALERW